jgi:hypothetical protein
MEPLSGKRLTQVAADHGRAEQSERTDRPRTTAVGRHQAGGDRPMSMVTGADSAVPKKTESRRTVSDRPRMPTSLTS